MSYNFYSSSQLQETLILYWQWVAGRMLPQVRHNIALTPTLCSSMYVPTAASAKIHVGVSPATCTSYGEPILCHASFIVDLAVT